MEPDVALTSWGLSVERPDERARDLTEGIAGEDSEQFRIDARDFLPPRERGGAGHPDRTADGRPLRRGRDRQARPPPGTDPRRRRRAVSPPRPTDPERLEPYRADCPRGPARSRRGLGSK